ncbi:type I-B CRISPR-associated protein Cas5b [Cellulophaga sp. BC115SP]|uniref:type I-B CRISPR-associated protein Cas5b n=1 Tax=Cellulophaga sp. BC115SP TaxID=2683263 RepID=UPI0014124F02|nr:type I-B CRISPR-associated protein Cas5b [Cellulophaga sp. BC115SP]NBB30206.1 type I-B CRISPR-associated protein Cas5 [Cellulophaga sp. BC115SP]
MANQKLISFDLQADFAFFKKPDHNVGILLSYNMLHKPALLGILGAIIGLEGYQKKGELPEYYHKLKDIPVGIEPLEGFHEKGNFQKTSVKYTNTVGYANDDGNLLVEETMLVKPAYRCYLLLDLENELHAKLYEYLKNGQAEYVPYLGKNEFQAWIISINGFIQEYEYKIFDERSDFFIRSIFIKNGILKNQKINVKITLRNKDTVHRPTFTYFERLPIGFEEGKMIQYEMAEFALTDWTIAADSTIDQLYEIYRDNDKPQIIQLF